MRILDRKDPFTLSTPDRKATAGASHKERTRTEAGLGPGSG